MSTRHAFALLVIVSTLSQIGCACMSGQCGLGCASCGVADASCGCPDACCDGPSCGLADSCCGDCASCGVADASCGCPDACCGGVGCGSCVRPQCPLLARLRSVLNRSYLTRCCCGGCGGRPYCHEWADCPPACHEPCDCYGNYTGGHYPTGGNYGGPHGRRAQLAKRNFADELRFADEEVGGPIYR